MIDNKKIEEASFEETFGMYGEEDSLQEGFTCGAKWAINEFLKDLWHPASEEPEINKEISKTFQQEQGEIKKLFDYRLQEFNKVSFSLSDKDKKQLQKADETLKKWWKFPAIISGFALVFAVLTGFLAFKFYKESVKSKEEIKTDIAKEMQSKNLIWVEKGEWDKLKDNRELVRIWSEKNPKDSKSLESFIKGYETFKKEGK